MYSEGMGVVQNDAEATLVSAGGRPGEQPFGPNATWDGCTIKVAGVEQDYREAAKWYLKAAKQNDAAAQSNLGQHENGQGVAQDYRLAMDYYKRSPSRETLAGETEHWRFVPSWFRRRSGDMKRLMVPTRRRSRRREQLEWHGCIRTVAARPKDARKALKWTQLAAKQGFAKADAQIGWYHATGKVMRQDDDKAVEWFRRGGKRRRQAAQDLGMYGEGRTVERDDVAAFKWIRKAAEQGDARGRRVGLALPRRPGRRRR